MSRNHSRGILAIGIICLFVGVGIHPAFAVDTRQSMVNKVSEDDCGCNGVDDRQLVVVSKQLNRLEVYSKLLLVLSKHIPEIKEKCEEILEIINHYGQLDFPIICDILESIDDLIGEISIFLYSLIMNSPSELVRLISYLLSNFVDGVYWVNIVIADDILNCDWAVWP